MATAKKKKISNIGQVSYLTKQVKDFKYFHLLSKVLANYGE